MHANAQPVTAVVIWLIVRRAEHFPREWNLCKQRIIASNIQNITARENAQPLPFVGGKLFLDFRLVGIKRKRFFPVIDGFNFVAQLDFRAG